MRAHLMAAAAVVLSIGAAHADPFESAYGNTVTTTLPDGSKQVAYVNRDGTWEQHEADGMVIKGTFVWKGERTACFTIVDPTPKDASKATHCHDIAGDHKLGETWSETDNGQTFTMAITAGR